MKGMDEVIATMRRNLAEYAQEETSSLIGDGLVGIQETAWSGNGLEQLSLMVFKADYDGRGVKKMALFTLGRMIGGEAVDLVTVALRDDGQEKEVSIQVLGFSQAKPQSVWYGPDFKKVVRDSSRYTFHASALADLGCLPVSQLPDLVDPVSTAFEIFEWAAEQLQEIPTENFLPGFSRAFPHLLEEE